MPIIKSAKKRVKVARKATIRNAKTKRTLRNALKSFQLSLTSKKTGAEGKAHSALDKAAKKGLLHKNKVARKKRQLAKAARVAGIKHVVGSKKAAAKKSPAKKTVAKKKAPAKKKK